MEQSSPVKVLSRKRKKAPPFSSHSNPSFGVLTRSKSRVYCHQNRSGKSRSDPITRESSCFRPEIEIETVKVPPAVNRINGFKPGGSLVHVKEEGEKVLLRSPADLAPDSTPVLDLVSSEAHDEQHAKELPILEDCAGNSSLSGSKTVLNRCGKRKVFKAPSSFSYRRLLPFLTDIMNDGTSAPKIEIIDSELPTKLQKLDSGNSSLRPMAENSSTCDFDFVPCFNATSLSENGEVAKLNEKMLEQQDLSDVKIELSKTEQIVRPLEVEQQCNENGVNKTDAGAEECCQMTPPELDVNTKTKFCCGDSMEANNMQVANQDFKGLSIGNQNNGKDAGGKQSASDKAGSTSANRSVLNPFSQLRLFKNSGSVSYRRLLPYLMDISKDITPGSKIIESPVPLVNLKEESHSISTPIAEQNCENSYEKHPEKQKQSSVSSTAPLQPSADSLPDSATPSPSMPTLSNISLTSFEPSSIHSEPLFAPSGLNDFQTAEATRPPPITPRKLESCFDLESSLPLPPPRTIDNDILSKESTSEEHGKAESIHFHVGLELQNQNKELVQNVNVEQGAFHSGGSEGLVTPTNGPFKGILRRNRPGCRGLCNCLNCSSFRLHADRSFEFSRNQMHDAEVIASELMKELENLRILMEKSSSNDNSLTASQLNPAQIKAACNRAIEAENIAKERLGQMNYELNMHCRIPVLVQPRVTFASSNTEKKV